MLGQFLSWGLFQTIGYENISLVLRMILGKGASARAEAYYGSTPLHVAALADYDSIVRALVAAGEWTTFRVIEERPYIEFAPLHASTIDFISI